MGAWQRPWVHGEGLGGVAKAVRANPKPSRNPNPKAVGALPRPWGQGQGCGGVAMAEGAWPSLGGATKALRAWPKP